MANLFKLLSSHPQGFMISVYGHPVEHLETAELDEEGALLILGLSSSLDNFTKDYLINTLDRLKLQHGELSIGVDTCGVLYFEKY